MRIDMCNLLQPGSMLQCTSYHNSAALEKSLCLADWSCERGAHAAYRCCRKLYNIPVQARRKSTHTIQQTWIKARHQIWLTWHTNMPTCRRKFLHNCIDGRLLLRLSDQQLKAEIGIGPMGHRVTLMEAIEQLAGAAAGASGSVSPEHYPYGANRGSRSPSASPERHGNGGHAMAWDTPVRPQRPLSAAPPTRASPAEAPRRPASASPNVLPPDAFLGPALGKVTVYEQRAKLLFELDRAMARAAQQNAAASQLMHHASTTTSEVEHLRGLLSDLERKNRAAFAGTTGRGTQPRPSSANTLDTKARIPWSHIGKGTKLKSWDPVRIGQPGDPETVDMTFQPRISTTSKRMLSEGAGGGAGADFLARLSASERKRTQAKSELERKYFAQAVGAGDGNGDSAMRQFERDFELIRRECESKQLGRLPREADRYEPMIDIMLDNLDQGTVRESGARLKPVRAAKGPAKVTAAAGVLRTIHFMDRYRNDVNGRNRREKELQDKWMRQTLGEAYLPGAKVGLWAVCRTKMKCDCVLRMRLHLRNASTPS